MRPLNLVAIIYLALTGCSYQTPVVVQPEKSDDGIIFKIEEMFGGKGIASEAYIVLKNDEVRYMADMEIIFFDDSVKVAFQKLCDERSDAQSKMSVEAINNNPAMAQAMQTLNASRTEIAEREKSIDGKVEEMRLKLIANLNESLNELSNELESGGKVLEEFKEITAPFDNAISKTTKEIDELKESQSVSELESNALQLVNTHIVNNSLKVPKIVNSTGRFAESILETREKKDAYTSVYSPKGFILYYRITAREFIEQASWKTLPNIPKECQDTYLVEALTKLVNQKESLEAGGKMLRSRLQSRKSDRRKALIPWENRHDVDQDQFEEQYGRITREYESTKQRLSALQKDGPERDQILEEMVSQIKDEISEQGKSLDEAEAEIHEEAIESMNENLRFSSYTQFTSMIASESKLSIRTGSKGDFIIPAGMDYLFASRSRSSGENIFWFLKIDPKFGNFRLSNSNAKFVGQYGDVMTWMYGDFYLE
ncbi:hypothetical protein OAE97_01920 [Verrucomicrobia bacterium]|jgi:D-ribose pyranose/furanose isomerase RbsD|nr:hypothetical protein [Verrucomicrobiota bacterium]MDG1891646.1 hypothetical protein [Verrucomicrobiota bacterium]